MVLPRVTAASMCAAGAAMAAPRRGVVHSAFAAAANFVFPDDMVISLNADAQASDRSLRVEPFPGMPNGIQVAAFPFAALRPGMPALLGAGRLVIDGIDCSLDLSTCPRWNACIARPARLNVDIVRKNAAWLEQRYLTETEHYNTIMPIAKTARALCGCGPGLTPAGDDMLLGWMAINWLLYGPDDAQLLAACAEILAVARRQTHVLSRCWLGYAARGCIALPVRALLDALTGDDERQLAAAAQVVLSMGATSGYDLVRGIVMGAR
jgi:hypothetical protein